MDILAFSHTGLDQPIASVTLSLGSWKNNQVVISGTATFIAPFLAITAKHVIEDYINKFKWSRNTENAENEIPMAFMNIDSTLVAVQILNDGKDSAIWDIRQIYQSTTSDIAYFTVTPNNETAKNHQWILPKVEILPPKIGSHISCFGYRESKGKIENNILDWEFNPTTATGIVKDIHHLRRDDFMINFPCIYTNARFDGGMSGGAVFNESGHLCAVISSNLPPTNDQEEHASYAALIWPTMNTMINMNREGIKNEGFYPILDLCKGNFINANNYDRIELKDSDKGKNTIVTLRNKEK